MMKSVGKIGSALAAFEDNIAKNHEHYGGGRSFLTTIAANPSTPKKLYKSITKQKISVKEREGSISDSQSSEKGNIDYSSSCLTTVSDDQYDALRPNKCPVEEELSCTTLSTADESAAKIQQPLLFKLDRPDNACNDDYVTGKGIPRCAHVQKPLVSKTNHNEKKGFESTTKTTLNGVALNEASERRRNSQPNNVVVRSLKVKDEKLSDPGIRMHLGNNKTGLSEKSPLHKIAATIRRVNKSNSFREAAKVAAKVDATSEIKSRTSKAANGSNTKTTTRLDDYVNQTTPAGYRKSISKSVTACTSKPGTTNSILPQANKSQQLNSSSHGIEGSAQCGPLNKIDNKNAVYLALESKTSYLFVEDASRQLPAEDEESITEVTADAMSEAINAGVKIFSKNRAKLSDYVNQTAKTNKISVEKSVASLPITSVSQTGHLDDQSFASLPVLPPSRGIAVAARRSSINMTATVIKHKISLPLNKEHSESLRDGPLTIPCVSQASDYFDDEMNSIKQNLDEIDMDYGPHNMSPKLPSPNHKIEPPPEQIFTALPLSICESSAASDGESLCGTEVTPIGIAKAARRSSVELISRAEYDEIVSMSGITSVSEESTMASWKTDEQEQYSTGESNIRRRPQKSMSNISVLSLDLYRQSQVFQHHDCRKMDDDIFESSFSTEVGQSIFLPRRAEVAGILRLKCSLRNISRHVRFADQQPGGGRRMSFQKSVKNDSLPVRPRRSSNFELDRLRNLRQKQHATTETAEPFHFMSHLAATTIQASFRRWIQWKAIRPQLLTRKLVWIEENRKSEILRIQQEKWDMMENIQSEIVERERRLEAQVSLAEKLCDHLKRDSAIVHSQSKKMKEFSNLLKINNNHLDQSVRLNRDNFVTANLAVEFLREKSDTLLATSKKYASRIDKLQSELEWATKRVDVEYRSKLKTKKTLNRILRLIKQRRFDPNGDAKCTTQPMKLEDLTAKEFDVTLHSSDGDMISLCSDITNDSIASPVDDMGHAMDFHHYNVNVPFCPDEINQRERSNSKSTAASCENSFATYDNQKIKRQISMDSLAGNSFASYNAPDVSRKVVTLLNDTEHTHTSNNSGSNGAAVPPRRLPSSDSCFSAIHEEESVSEESLDSGDI